MPAAVPRLLDSGRLKTSYSRDDRFWHDWLPRIPAGVRLCVPVITVLKTAAIDFTGQKLVKKAAYFGKEGGSGLGTETLAAAAAYATPSRRRPGLGVQCV